ncbi:MAG: hypothetical protein GX649_16615, partial [Chloroflexi bacterium]|nr:hypothetical protein [Chloroflexota bacterium]
LAALNDELVWPQRPRVLALASVPYRRIGALQAALRAAIRQAGPLAPKGPVLAGVLAVERVRGEPAVGEAFLHACLRLDPRVVEHPDGLEVLSDRAGPVRSGAIAALRALGEPAHHQKVRAAMNAGRPAGARVTARGLLECLNGHRDTFVRVGQGIYALAECGLPWDRDMGDAACRVLAARGGRPLSLGEIADGVLAAWCVQKSRVGQAVRRDARIVRVGWNRYARRSE